MKRPEGFDAPKAQKDEARRPGKSAPSPGRPERAERAKPAAQAKQPAQPRQAEQRPDRPARQEQAGRPVVVSPLARPPRQPRAERPEPVPRAQRKAERREAKRFTRGSRRRRAVWVTLLGIVTVLVLVLVVAVFSPILALRTIEVDGVSAIPASTVQQALSGEIGTPLALLNDQQIRTRLSRIILIRSYTTEVVPPNTLVVRIVEREAIGVLPDHGQYDQVDPAGVVLRTTPTTAGLPIIDIGKAGVDSPGFAAAVKVLLAMPSSVLTEVNSISATTLDNVSLTLDKSSQTIFWGSSAQSDLKAQALAALLPKCTSQQVLNVSAPLAVACGPAQPTPTPTPTPTATSGT